jgi:DNA-binding response OmpR family regulator
MPPADSDDMRYLWNPWLTAHGFRALEPQNGAEALHQVDERPPDLVLLDVMIAGHGWLGDSQAAACSRSDIFGARQHAVRSR